MIRIECFNDDCKVKTDDISPHFYIVKKVRIVVDDKGEFYKDYMSAEGVFNIHLTNVDTLKCLECDGVATIIIN